MGEDLGNHRGIFDGGDDRQGAATVRTVRHILLEETEIHDKSLLGQLDAIEPELPSEPLAVLLLGFCNK